MTGKVNSINILVLISTIFFNLLGAISGKYMGINLGNMSLFIIWLFILGASLFLRTFSWIYLHKRFRLSFIYPILSLNYLFSLFLGKILFGEIISVKKIIGSVIIIAGVCAITLSKDKFEDYGI